MSIEIKMPALSPTMEKGTIAKWLVNEGDSIKPGDLIAEIETDKATMEIEAIDEGVITSIVVPEGSDGVPVGAVIAMIAEYNATVAPSELVLADVTPAIGAQEHAKPSFTVVAPITMPAASTNNSDINASSLARRIATVKGLSLLGIAGTGPRGRIVKADLGLKSFQTAPMTETASNTTPLPATTYAPPAGVPVNTVKLSGMRKTIARRLTESKQTVPHFYLTAHCSIDALLMMRHELNDSLSGRGVKLSVNDLLIKAMALAMVREPDTNVQFAGEEIYRFGQVDIAMAVAIEGGLITPVIHDVAHLSLSAVAEQSRQLVAKARVGKLIPEEYQGGTASISNLGMYGIDEMIPVINPPQALILGIGSGIKKPWNIDENIALATIMTATASFDHRAIDGAAAARFMSAFRDLIEKPMQIIC